MLLTSPTSIQARRLLRWTALKPSLQTSFLDDAPTVTRLKTRMARSFVNVQFPVAIIPIE